MDRGAWRAAVHGVAEGQTWLGDFTFTFHFHALEKEMATHSSVLGESWGRGTWWAAIYGVAQSWTWLKRVSSNSKKELFLWWSSTWDFGLLLPQAQSRIYDIDSHYSSLVIAEVGLLSLHNHTDTKWDWYLNIYKILTAVLHFYKFICTLEIENK